jgi:hypothetical protein
MLLAKSRNQLIEKKLVMLQAAYLLTGMRQRVLSFPHALPRRLVGKNEHEIGQILREECHALLRDLATWPERMTDPDWIEKIDPDLRGQVGDADDRGRRRWIRGRSFQTEA